MIVIELHQHRALLNSGATAVRVSFNEPINPATFAIGDVHGLKGPGGPIAVAAVVPVGASNITAFDIGFAAQTSIGDYSFNVGSQIRDVAGNRMDQDGDGINGGPDDRYAGGFSIVVDTVAPYAVAAEILGSATAVVGIRVTYSEAIDPLTFSTAAVSSFTGPNGPLLVSGVLALPGNQMFDVLFSTQPTPGNYNLVIGPTIADASGNLVDQNRNGIGGEPSDGVPIDFSIIGSVTVQGPVQP